MVFEALDLMTECGETVESGGVFELPGPVLEALSVEPRPDGIVAIELGDEFLLDRLALRLPRPTGVRGIGLEAFEGVGGPASLPATESRCSRS